MGLDISRSLVMALGLTTALAATACGDDTGGGGGSGGGSASSGDASSTATGGPDCATLCSTYGGAVPQVVDQIVADALADPDFVDDFQPLADQGDERVTLFKTNLTNFISDAYGCSTGKYTGPTMADAHVGQAITSEEYDAFVTLCAGSLVKSGVPQDYVEACFAPGLTDATLKASIVGK